MSTSIPLPPTDEVSVSEQKDALPDEQQQAMMAAMEVQKKYEAERDKRMTGLGDDQYVDLSISDRFKSFREDPWLDERSDAITLKDGDKCKYLITGAGFGGLLFAVRLVQAGISPKDIRIVDSAGGFGGTWYWNRYPGLMCDVESYIYMPLLEETGYMPKHKYAQGHELRKYTNSIAEKWNLVDQASFRTKADRMDWDDEKKEWVIKLTKERTGQEPLQLTVRSQFVMTASGVLLHPKLPNLPGIETFKGHMFHTARFNYDVTGGSPEQPDMTNLKDKRVGIIGTGATAIQAVPQLAKWSKHLTVFQRTPSAVDRRDNRETDPEWWQKISSKKGWQLERARNYNDHLLNDGTEKSKDMVDDGWTKIRAYRSLTGASPIVTPDKVAEFVGSMYAADYPRSQMVRARVDEIVKDKETAEKLKAWYPGWCKRPTFHDDYLPTFNQPNVTLVDTDGKGADRITEKGIVYNGKEYELDVLIFSTGFRSPVIGSPAYKAGMKVTGRNGQTLDEKWEENMATLHGVFSHDFPNLFWPGPNQAGATANFVYMIDELAKHVAFIISEAKKVAEKDGSDGNFSIEPSAEAEEAWTMQIMMRAMNFAAMSGCTPSYFNNEGQSDLLPMELKMKRARLSPWGEGAESFVKVIEGWRNEGGLQGVEIKA